MTRFVVIGGDAAGMSAAAQATRGVGDAHRYRNGAARSVGGNNLYALVDVEREVVDHDGDAHALAADTGAVDRYRADGLLAVDRVAAVERHRPRCRLADLGLVAELDLDPLYLGCSF